MYENEFNNENLLALCRMFIKESNNFKNIVNNFYEEFSLISESMYYLSKSQEKILNELLKHLKINDVNLDNSYPSFYYFMTYKRNT